MAELVLTNCFVSIDGNDVSANVKSVTINYASEILDKSAMSDTSRERIAGLKDWSMDFEFNQNFAASGLDSILFPLVGTSIPVIVRPDAGSVSTSNPNYTGAAFLENYNPIEGAHGELGTSKITMPGNGALSRATS